MYDIARVSQRFAVSILLLMLFCVSTVSAEVRQATKIIGSRVVDLEGNLVQLGMDGTVLKPVVISFLAPNCSLNAKQQQTLSVLNSTVRGLGGILYGVIPGSQLNWRDAVAYKERHGFDFPVILDSDRNLIAQLQPTSALETVLVDKYDKQLFRGGANAKSVAQALKGRNVNDAVDVNACALQTQQVLEKPNYNRHIASFMQANCVECHRPNGIGPFPLRDYAETKNFAAIIGLVTKQRIMPPWKATPGSGHYLNERLLSEQQMSLLENWVKAGALEGDSKDVTPLAKIDTSQWRMGEPDIVISMPEAFTVPASGPDIYRYFVAKDAIPKDLEIAAIDFIPGDASVVHHTNFFVDYGGKARKKDLEDPAPGFSVFGTGGFFSYWDKDNTAAGLGAWAPGGNPVRYPDGMGMRLPGGADFIFEIHYHPTGKAAVDKSRLGIYLAKKPITKPVKALFVGTNQVDIPAGEKNYKRQFYMVLPADMKIVDIGPHMHYLGTHASVIATLPDGKKVSLLDVNWDFRWQGAYHYREPLFLPKGTRIDTVTSYDNSSDNPYNPYNPPVRATWGWGTDQEMGELYITILADSDNDARKLARAAQESWLRPSDPALISGELSMDETIDRLRHASTWESEGESLIRLLIADEKSMKKSSKIIEKRLKKNPDDARMHMVYGSLNAVAGSFSESSWSQYSYYSQAVESYEKALALDASLWDARYGIAPGYAADDSKSSQTRAINEYTILMKQQESEENQREIYALPYIDLGDLYKRMGNQDKAKITWQRGVKLHPHSQHLVERLGLKKK